MGVATQPSLEAADGAQCLTANLSWLLSQASHALATEMTAGLEHVGVSPRAFCVLKTAMTGEHTQKELAHAVGLDKTTMVVTIDELEAAGLAKRLPSSEDRRARVIAVTKAGERKVARAEGIVQQIQDDVLATLPPRDRKILLDALTRLVCERLATPAECSRPVRRRAPRA